ncbi:MAG: DUF2079 domain-containing protein [Cytophagaceae bacterium]
MILNTILEVFANNIRQIRSININICIVLISIFVLSIVKSGENVIELFLLNNETDIAGRVIFIGLSIFIIAIVNLLLIIFYQQNKDSLNSIWEVSLYFSSIFLFIPYLLLTSDLLEENLSIITIVISILYLLHLFTELHQVNKEKSILNKFETAIGNHTTPIIYTLSIIYFLYFGFLSVITYLNFDSPTHDTGIFTSVVYKLSKFKSPYFSLYDINFFQHHFSPILFILVPFYWIFPSPITILLIQSLMLGLASIYVFKLGKLFTGSILFALLIQTSYLLHPAVHGTNLFDFHEVAFLPIFVLGALYYYEIKSYKLYWIFFTLAIFVKEDVPIFTAIYGLYLALGRKDWKVGISTIVISIVYYLIVKSFLTHGILFSRYGELMIPGTSPEKGIILTLVTNPIYVIKLVLENNKKLSFIVVICLPLLFLAFRSGFALILLIPSFIYGLLTNYGMHFSVKFHNPLPFIPPLYYLSSLATKNVKVNYASLSIFILLASIAANYSFGSFNPTMEPIVKKLESKDKREIINSRISIIPDTASVTTNVSLVPNLCTRDSVFTFAALMHYDTQGKLYYNENENPKYSITNDANYILWDNKFSWCWPLASRDEGFNLIKTLAERGDYGLVSCYGGVYLLKKNYKNEKNHLLNKYYGITLPRSSGKDVKDQNSEMGYVLYADPDVATGNTFLTWGPYANLEKGKYEIKFRIKSEVKNSDEEVLIIEAYKDPGIYLANKLIKSNDFVKDNTYVEFSLPLEVSEPLRGVEFRIFYKGSHKVWIDYIYMEKVE